MKEIVYFFDRRQVEGNEKTKAVVVEKINAEGKQNQQEHPNYITVEDVYEISMFYRVTDVQQVSFSQALSDVEDMANETLRILETVYSPSMDNGTFWYIERNWFRRDHIDSNQPQLQRTLTLRLSKITSFDGKLFKGYGTLLHFDTPAGHLYAELQNINDDVGYNQIPEPISGTNTPLFFTDVLDGTFTADMYVSEADLGTNDWDINTIGTIKANGEVLEATMVQLSDNDESPARRITKTTKVKIESALFVTNVQDLIKYSMSGQIIEYPTVTVGAAP